MANGSIKMPSNSDIYPRKIEVGVRRNVEYALGTLCQENGKIC